MKAFPCEDGSMIGNFLKEDLVKRGFIEKVGDGELATDYVITHKFTDIFVKDIHNATEEIWSVYPAFIKINGTPASLLNIDKYRLANLYGERIDYSIEEHKEIVKDIAYGNKHGLIRVNIESFVKSEQWMVIRPFRKGSEKEENIQKVSETF
jgi:hypothetical protein